MSLETLSLNIFLNLQAAQLLSCVRLFCDPMDCGLPGSSVHGIPQEGYWSGLPLPSPGDLPNPGIEPLPPKSLALAGRFFTTEPPRKPIPKSNIKQIDASSQPSG